MDVGLAEKCARRARARQALAVVIAEGRSQPASPDLDSNRLYSEISEWSTLTSLGNAVAAAPANRARQHPVSIFLSKALFPLVRSAGYGITVSDSQAISFSQTVRPTDSIGDFAVTGWLGAGFRLRAVSEGRFVGASTGPVGPKMKFKGLGEGARRTPIL
jgi:hypothetical protein